MAGLSTGLKKKLSISPCDVDKNVKKSASFELMLNPAAYQHEYRICYNKKMAFGQLASESKFSGFESDRISFDIVIDGTGVVNAPIPGVGSPDVKTQMKQLSAVVYKYDGSGHEPNHVQVLWGSLVFYGRLESMGVEYTLFTPGGDPLRAKVKLAFVGFMSPEEETRQASRSSADLTHRVDVKAGDTLPLLCHRIYRDSAYYVEVARFNDLDDFRDIRPGTTLRFPPLR